MHGAAFGGAHSKEYAAIMNYARVTPPAAKENYVDIAGGDSDIDLTEAVGGVVFEDGQIDFKFTFFRREDRERMKNALHGRRMEITLDREPDFYYEGRVRCTKEEQSGSLHELYITAKVKPYKFERRETVHIERVEGVSKEAILSNSRMPVMPVVTVSGDMTLTYEGVKYHMEDGVYRIPEFTLYVGRSRIGLSGNGTVKFVYWKGRII